VVRSKFVALSFFWRAVQDGVYKEASKNNGEANSAQQIATRRREKMKIIN
jgi:hypothetical protein